jgi:hypothetical protein
MKTMTVTQARKRLGAVLSRVLKGEDIGIVHSATGSIIVLRPASLYSDDYALMEYGLTQKELDKSFKKVSAEIEREARAGKLKKFV